MPASFAETILSNTKKLLNDYLGTYYPFHFTLPPQYDRIEQLLKQINSGACNRMSDVLERLEEITSSFQHDDELAALPDELRSIIDRDLRPISKGLFHAISYKRKDLDFILDIISTLTPEQQHLVLRNRMNFGRTQHRTLLYHCLKALPFNGISDTDISDEGVFERIMTAVEHAHEEIRSGYLPGSWTRPLNIFQDLLAKDPYYNINESKHPFLLALQFPPFITRRLLQAFIHCLHRSEREALFSLTDDEGRNSVDYLIRNNPQLLPLFLSEVRTLSLDAQTQIGIDALSSLAKHESYTDEQLFNTFALFINKLAPKALAGIFLHFPRLHAHLDKVLPQLSPDLWPIFFTTKSKNKNMTLLMLAIEEQLDNIPYMLACIHEFEYRDRLEIFSAQKYRADKPLMHNDNALILAFNTHRNPEVFIAIRKEVHCLKPADINKVTEQAKTRPYTVNFFSEYFARVDEAECSSPEITMK